MLDDFERGKFPAGSCTIQNVREKGVMDSTETYLCLIVDERLPTQARLEYMHPYTARDGRRLRYAWVSISSDSYVDHCTNPVHDDSARIVAWKRVDVAEPFIGGPWPG